MSGQAAADSGGGTPQAWRVDLPALSNAIAAIQREKNAISETLDQIEMKIRPEYLGADWHGPAKESFEPLRQWYTSATINLMDLLDEIISRMQKSYDNYHQAELKNLQNLTPTEPQI